MDDKCYFGSYYLERSRDFAKERLLKILVVKTNDRVFDDSNASGSMQDNAAELDTQVAIADGPFLSVYFG